MKTRSRIAILMLTLICLSVPAWSQQNQQEETSYLFQLVLLMGSIEGESKLEGVSANVVKAPADYGGMHTISTGRSDMGSDQPGASGGVMRAPRGPRRLIESSFSLEVGETIVVGSSKLNGGGEALLVLLTAIP